MVRQEKIWDINAIPDATFVSFPNALGIIIVFNPKGIARAQIPQIANVFGRGITSITPRYSKGYTSNRSTVTK